MKAFSHPRLRLRIPVAGVLCLVALAAAGCSTGSGSASVRVPPEQTAAHRGAVLFNERCAGCHSIDGANAHGSKPEGQAKGGERTNGPNFNARKIGRDDALYAIRNGGFSGAIMPANIVVGKDADMVAEFLEKYSGGKPSSFANPDENR